ncbi:MAG TPA: hypothetical protein VG605_08155 [Puia sp.]|nr:hypothetical protein [Puia sp.]
MNQAADTNQFFSYSRWKRLIALHWEGNKKRYLLAIPAIAALILTWETFLLLMSNYNPLDDGLQAFTYYWGLGIVGCLYSSTIFAELGNQRQGIAWLSAPASAFEKLLCGLLFSTLLGFIVFTIAFYLADIPMVEIGNSVMARQHRVWPGGYPIGPNPIWRFWRGLPGDEMDQRIHTVLVLYFILQGAFALGSVYFKRLAFLKTLVTVLVFILAFIALQKEVVENLLPQGWHVMPPIQDWITRDDSLRVRTIRLSPWVGGPLGLLLLLGIPPVFWIATYFRIKEKEV